MTPALAYEWLAPKLSTDERKALDVVYSAAIATPPPKVTAALRAAEASLTEMVRDGRAWDCDRRALAAVRECLPI